jgi:hypothetical protein
MARAAILVTLLAACDSPPGQTVGFGGSGEAVAMIAMSADGRLAFAYTTAEEKARLPEVLGGQAPRDFPWVMITVLAPESEQAMSPQGLDASLADAGGRVMFAQVYPGPCNPATDDFSHCWLLESLVSGDDGVGGTLRLRITSASAVGGYDATFEGLTDRFGAPVQWLAHETTGSFDMPVEAL